MKLSIVLTVYNMESCLSEALDSIKAQTFGDFEVVCIDDGSTDASPAILQACAREDARFSVHTFENQGPAEARNRGLELATGEYVIMLDSDDVFEPELFEKLVNRADATSADVVVVRSDEFQDGSDVRTPTLWTAKADQIPDKLIFSSHDMADYIFTAFVGWPWDKLYRRSFIEEHGLRYPDISNSEDLYFVFLSLVLAQRISLVDNVLIHHRMNRAGSVSNSRMSNPEAFYEGICLLKDALKTQTDRYGELSWGFLNWALHYALWNIDTMPVGAVRELMLNKLLAGKYPELELEKHGANFFGLVPDAAWRVQNIHEEDREGAGKGSDAAPSAASMMRKFAHAVRTEGMGSAMGKVKNVVKRSAGIGASEPLPARGTALSALPAPYFTPAGRPLVDPDDSGVAVSVVMPCFNAVKYLKQAMDSVVNQTLKNIEIVCVNDGSTDNTLEMLQEYADADPRIKIVTGPNGGYGVAMNKGVAAATGRYVGILEPDDYLELDMFQKLYTVACAFDADAVKSDYFRFWTDEDGVEHPTYMHTSHKPEFYNTPLVPGDDPATFSMEMVNWTGIYRTDFLREHDIKFHESPGASYQDNGFWFQVFCQAKRLVVIDEPFYHYRVDNSASSINQSNKTFAMLNEYAWIRDFLREHPELEKQFIGVYHYVKTFNLNFAFSILAPELRFPFAERYAAEYREAAERGELDQSLFWPDEWIRVQRIMEDPVAYVERYNADELEGKAEPPENEGTVDKIKRHLANDGVAATAQMVVRKLSGR